MTGFRAFVLGVVTAAAAYGAYRWFTTPYTIVNALADGKVTAHTVFGGLDSASTITVSRSAGTTGAVTMVVPAGTVLVPSEPDAQRVITATAVTIVIPAGADTASAQVRTYCLDEFAPVPPMQASLAFAAVARTSTGSRDVVTEEETEPLHKLAACLEDSSLSNDDRQVAVWAVHDGLLTMTRDNALARLAQGFEQQLTREFTAKVERTRPAIVAASPHLTADEIDDQIQAAVNEQTLANRDEAQRLAERQLANLVQHDREMLSSCGFDPNQSPLFQ